MDNEIALAGILGIEDCPEILAIRCPDTGIPIWTTIRSAFLRLIMGDLLYGTSVVGSGGVRGALSNGARLRTLSTMTRAFAHNAVRLAGLNQAFPVIVMATGARLVERDERYFNCLSDYFVGAAVSRTLAIEDVFHARWPFPRQHPAVLFQTPLRVEGVLLGRLRAGRFQEQATKLVELVLGRAQTHIGWDAGDARRKWLTQYCANAAASLAPRYRKYQTIFQRTGARVLIKEEACYGGADNAAAVLAARNLGMVTAEYQHGAITAGHDAYNFAPAVSDDPGYQKILPDYLLAYGAWWGEQMNAPVEVLVIGNPHRTETLAARAAGEVERLQILVLGDGLSTPLYLELCARLADAFPGAINVVFRPHPLERGAIFAEYPNGAIGAVRIDPHQDIYQSFRASCAVVSEVSTGLFEAIGQVPKVFIWDTAKARFSVPKHDFQGFADADELVRLMRDDNAGRVSTEQVESLWAPHWQRNYLDFLEKAVLQ